MKLSDHFDTSEFACHCGCGYGSLIDDVDPQLIEILEDIREQIGRSVVISSGCRCLQHNSNVGGVISSAHTRGRAADILVHGGADRYAVLVAAVFADAAGIGIAKSFVHIDVDDANRHRPAAWSY